MFRFLLKCSLVLLIFFVGVILGMQKASTGMFNMRGYEDPLLYNAVSISNDENGQLNAELLGQEVNTHDLQEKKERLEEMKAFNVFSNLGKKATKGAQDLFNNLIEVVVPD
jgi:hypothetical protein